MASAAEQLAGNLNFSAFSKATELKQRIWFTLIALMVYRLATYLPLPGIDPIALEQMFSQNQSGILGMHAIQERPVARNGEIVIRPMMYLAHSYDHRVIDGKEAVTFLVKIKEAIEEPARLALGI